MTIRDVINTISKEEWVLVKWLTVFVMMVTMIPPLVGWFIGFRTGLTWTGIQFFAPGDFGVYLSQIAQPKSGVFQTVNQYTTEPLIPIVNILWGSIGSFAAVLHLTPVAAFYLARLLLIPVFSLTAYLAISFFQSDKASRRWAYFMLMLTSGVGIYFAPFFAANEPFGGRYEWPIDLWVAESQAFLSMAYSPHFIASFTLILAVILVLLLGFKQQTHRYAIIAGVLAAVLFQFHPFHAPTLYAVFGTFLAIELLRKHNVGKQIIDFVIFLLISIPAVAYHFYLQQYSSQASEILIANTTITPSPHHLLIGFGVPLIFALIALRKQFRTDDILMRFLVVWFVVQFVLIYAPFTFQRRLIEGLQFPMVLLAAPVLVALIAKARHHQLHILAYLLIAVLFLPTSFATILRNVEMYRTNTPAISYRSEAQDRVVDWIRMQSPKDARFLSFMGAGSLVTGWGERVSYLGHWVNSGDTKTKNANVRAFFHDMNSAERNRFMVQHGLTHVFVGVQERIAGGDTLNTQFVPVYSQQDIVIYEFRVRQ